MRSSQATGRDLVRQVRQCFAAEHRKAFGSEPERDPFDRKAPRMLLERAGGDLSEIKRRIKRTIADAREAGFGASLASVDSRWSLSC